MPSPHFVYMDSARSVAVNELAPAIPPHMHAICMGYAGLASSSPMRRSKALGKGCSPGLSSGKTRSFSSLLFSLDPSITQATNSSRAPSASFSLPSPGTDLRLLRSWRQYPPLANEPPLAL
ncbi:uncharacterized protein TrAtP1_013012 [Trichoderma atroviride]|uniref:uncharacterized protein n=1 Tax=Hypocrea atroviridis TaxID=63577 RepID=UPI00331C74FC|nr:hypothetical protein TrAtP1_013012 [Trichoderma atroviride]